MTQDDFSAKWRYEIAGLLMEAATMDFKVQRRAMFGKIETMLVEMYADLSQPVGPIPPAVLAKCRELFAAVKDVEGKKAETPKGGAK